MKDHPEIKCRCHMVCDVFDDKNCRFYGNLTDNDDCDWRNENICTNPKAIYRALLDGLASLYDTIHLSIGEDTECDTEEVHVCI